VAGDQFTAADVYVASHIGWGMQVGTVEKRPHFVEYLSHISERPAFKRALQLDEEASKDLQPTG
jgi:glutathione S-transferase